MQTISKMGLTAKILHCLLVFQLIGAPGFAQSLQNAASPEAKWQSSGYKDRLGLQMWSLKTVAKQNPYEAMDIVASYGLVDVETAGTGELSGIAYSSALAARGLKAVSAHVTYDRLKNDLAGVIKEAKELGVEYVICPTLTHDEGVFDYRNVAKQFNEWGRALSQVGLRFGYHTHGFEFRNVENGLTAFDIMMQETEPENVCYEMDVFWVVNAGVDPVALLDRYPRRWHLMHIKDMRKGATPGGHTGKAAASEKVPVGSGQIDWAVVLRRAELVGVRYYFVEDESLAPLDSIPRSLDFLRKLKLNN